MLFERSADAIFLFDPKQQVFVDCNQAVVEMMRATSEEQLLMLRPDELSPEFQPDGRKSRDKTPEMTELALTRGSHRFEWQVQAFSTHIPIFRSSHPPTFDHFTNFHRLIQFFRKPYINLLFLEFNFEIELGPGAHAKLERLF